MLLRETFSAVIVSTLLTGCASAPSVSSAPPVSSGASAEGDQNVNVYPVAKRWTATLNPTRSYNAIAVGSQRQNAYGRVELTVSPSNPMLTHVVLNITVPNEPGLDVVGWGLSEGRCGSGNPTVLSPSAFPPIQLGPSGKGTADVRIAYVLPDQGTYHVNVFRGSGTQLTDVITCGELRRDD